VEVGRKSRKRHYGTTVQQTAMQRDWFHSNFIENGSFLTIKNVTLGYNVNVNRINIISRLRYMHPCSNCTPSPNIKATILRSATAQILLQLGDDNSGYLYPEHGLLVSMWDFNPLRA